MDEDMLVNIMYTLAVTSLGIFLDKSPDLEKIMKNGKTTTEDWDVLFTAAGVGFALTSQNLNKGKTVKKLATLNPHLPFALENYLEFINLDKPKNREELAAQTGYWVVWSLRKERPGHESDALVSLIGRYLDIFLAREMEHSSLGE